MEKKEAVRRLFSFDRGDWKYVIFFVVLLAMVYFYRHDTQQCRNYLADECINKAAKSCMIQKYVEAVQKKGLQVQCDEEGNCLVSGVKTQASNLPNIDYLTNLTIKEENSSNK